MSEMNVHKLSDLQLELLKVYSFNPSQEELIEIKEMLAQFFSKRLVSAVDKSIQENNITEEDLEKWLYEKS